MLNYGHIREEIWARHGPEEAGGVIVITILVLQIDLLRLLSFWFEKGKKDPNSLSFTVFISSLVRPVLLPPNSLSHALDYLMKYEKTVFF